MASSTSININPPTHETTKRKRKKKPPPITTDADIHRRRRLARWKSAHQHQAYSSDLLHALSRPTLTAQATRGGGRAVRVVADRALAVAAKGRTRWSRAILTGGRVLKLSKLRKKQRRPNRATTGKKSTPLNSRNVVKLKGGKKSLAAVQRKVRVLGRLVPGCRKEGLPVVLEEATDYIAALEMQVRAMTVLANLLSGSTNT